MPQIINASCYNSDRICNLSFVPEVRGARWWYVVCPRLYQVRANLQTIFCCIVWRSLHLPTHELNNRAAAILIIMVANQINEAKVEVSTNGFFKWTPMSLPQNNHWWQSLFHLWDKWECNKIVVGRLLHVVVRSAEFKYDGRFLIETAAQLALIRLIKFKYSLSQQK